MARTKLNQAVVFSKRVYQLLLVAYPQAFRREYGSAVVQLFRDQCQEACVREGGWGLTKTWWRGLVDLGRSAYTEQMSNLKGNLNMTATPWLNKTRRGLALAVFILVCGLSIVATWFLPRYFVSVARITVNKDTPAAMDQSPPAGTIYDPYFVQTEFERLRSKAVLYPVIERLDLDKRWASALGTKNPLSKQETFMFLQKNLDFRHSRNTSIIEIRVFSEDKNEAAEIANAIADVYRVMRIESLEVMSIHGLESLQRELKKQEEKVEKAQARVQDLREAGNIPNGLDEGQGLAGSERLRHLENQTFEAELASGQLEALHDHLARLDRNELRQALPTAHPDVLLNDLLTRYNQAEVELLAIQKNRASEHPETQRAQAVLDKLDMQIEQRISGILAGLKLKAQNLAQENALRLRALKDQQSQIARASSQHEAYFSAKRELENQKQLHRAIAARILQEKIDAHLPKTASVEIVDRAEPGLRPVRPNWAINVAGGILLGVLASAIVLLLMLLKNLLLRPVAHGA